MNELLSFMQLYCYYTNLHEYNLVKSLMLEEVVYCFDDKSYSSAQEIKSIFEKTWNSLPDEVYTFEEVKWLSITTINAVCIYNYNWKGTNNNGITVKGSGKGTNVLVKQHGTWKIILEHLSKLTNHN